MRSLRSFFRDKRGNVAITFAVALVPIIGSVGAAIDYTRASTSRSRLQSATDAAALSSLLTSPAARTATAINVFHGAKPSGLSSTQLEVSASSTESVVTASASVETSMAKLLHLDRVNVSARSKAIKVFAGPPACVIALHKTASPGIEISGSSSFVGKKCALQSNSSATGAITIGGSSTVKADGFCAVGTVQTSSALVPAPEDHCDELPDPFAKLPVVLGSTCDPNSKPVSVGPKEVATLNPGTYCGGLDLKGDVTLNPGLYVIRDGELSINSQGTITGKGVTFYLKGKGASFSINGGSKTELSAMQDGAYAGMLIVQDRDSNIGATNKINGNSGTILVGAVYTPTQDLTLNGNGTFGQGSPFMPMIANTVKISGSNTTVVEVDGTKSALVEPLPKLASGARPSERALT